MDVTDATQRRISIGKALLAGALLSTLTATGLVADTVTLPVAASVVGAGGAPFVSDVRLFNTSYTDVLTVTAVYRCFSGCAQPVAPQAIQLAAREAKGFDDVCKSLFGAGGSLGAIEFSHSGGAGQLLVTSQLRSPVSTGGFVGMFIPGLPSTSAKAVTILAGLVNGDARTNIGVYNPNDVLVTATIRLFDGPVLLGVVTVPLGPRTGAQTSPIYAQVGFGSLVRSNGYATVESSNSQSPLFTYAAEADNVTQDTILVVGAPDVAAPPGFNPPTPTQTSGASGPTATPTPPGPTSTPTRTPTPGGTQTITIEVKAWDFSPGGPVSPSLILQAGTTYRLVFHDVDSASTPNAKHGFSGISDLGLPSGEFSRGGPDFVIPSFTPQAFQRGNWPFKCTQESPPCGGDAESHQGMIGLLIIQ